MYIFFLYNKKKWKKATKGMINAIYSGPKGPMNDLQQLTELLGQNQQLHKSGQKKMVINTEFKWLGPLISDYSNHIVWGFIPSLTALWIKDRSGGVGSWDWYRESMTWPWQTANEDRVEHQNTKGWESKAFKSARHLLVYIL